MKKITLLIAIISFAFSVQAQQKKTAAKPPAKTAAKVKKETMVEIWTDYGTVVARLYDSTPLHRDNFIKLVQQKFFDSLLFHRVIDGFMIQGGDPNSKNAAPGIALGDGSAPGDRIPAEFKNNIIHKKGALAAARDNNPEKASSNCQFYIVQGKPLDDISLNSIECQRVRTANPAFAYTDAQRKAYKTTGGTPFLDQNYTVFGEVVKGLDVIDKIAQAQKDERDRPVKDIRMKIRILK
ncbi:MAG: peptidylprolyl isomerase [Chitinophagaceae bacterium]|nr:peptidylprolyl isomerase [Chitinophagaceae bacterium]